MRTILIALFVSGMFLSCETNTSKEHQDHERTETTENAEKEEINVITPSFTNVDAHVSTHIQSVVDHYIHIKTALVNSNSGEANNGATAILNAVNSFDKSFLPADQTPVYNANADGIKANAQIITTEGDIEQQRVAFASLSNNVYGLIKAFGANKPLYHDHCPMALNDQGAMWLSETEEIKNPYFGDEMMECGSVEEVIQK